MDSIDATRIPAYLLRRMSDGERDAFEARLLEEPELLERVRATEAAILSGAYRVPLRRGRTRAAWFSFGAAIGAGLVVVAQRVLL